jgi:hypothetical protein
MKTGRAIDPTILQPDDVEASLLASKNNKSFLINGYFSFRISSAAL